MTDQAPTCPYGPESDVDARYLAGSLPADESEAFEEHYFGCDRCFAAVQRGTEIRAAMSRSTVSGSTEERSEATPITRTRRRFSSWQPVLAAAGLIIVAVGVRQVGARRERTEGASAPPTIDAPRGAGNAVNLTSHATSTVLAAAWSRPSTARSYRVRLLATDGSLLFEREIADTSIMLSRDLVRGNDRVYWEVQALDALRSIVATSSVVQAQTSPSPP